ncbi:MAG: Rrf2 family transcriptional regulator [Rectinema sp.]|nr:Rrf2 family transcriptional regulator [Rectinema sp.]
MFQVPTKTQYAIRALVYLVHHGAASVASIAEAERISPKYLEAIISQLKNAAIVVADRGRTGGYRLAVDARSILMSDVVRAMEGDVKPVVCVDSTDRCVASAGCLPRRFWLGLKKAVDDYLQSVTLADIAEPVWIGTQPGSDD